MVLIKPGRKCRSGLEDIEKKEREKRKGGEDGKGEGMKKKNGEEERT